MPSVSKQTTKLKRKSQSVIDRIAPVGLDERGIKINVYGRSGTGKTTLACTFPKPLLLIGTEDGTRSVHNVKGVDWVRIKSSEELEELTQYAQSSDHKTVVLDSASALQDMVLKEILGLDELPVQRSWGMAKQQDWGQCAMQTKERLRSLLSLDCHVVIIAQEREFNADTESDLLMPFVGSALTPSVTGWLNPACDYIVQTFLRQKTEEKRVKIGGKIKVTRHKGKGVEYCVRTGPDATYTTKFRLPKGSPLPDVIVDGDFSKINSLITEGA